MRKCTFHFCYMIVQPAFAVAVVCSLVLTTDLDIGALCIYCHIVYTVKCLAFGK